MKSKLARVLVGTVATACIAALPCFGPNAVPAFSESWWTFQVMCSTIIVLPVWLLLFSDHGAA